MYKKVLQQIKKQRVLSKAENPFPGKQPKHSDHIRSVAESYAKSKGFNLEHPKSHIKVNPERAKRIAQAYHDMKHDPDHPEVKESYNALIQETLDQFEHIKNNTNMKFSKIKEGMENPYASSKEVHSDIRDNNHLWYFPTESGYGSDSDSQPQKHPMLSQTKHTHEDGTPMLANDVFRIVHDYFGHSKEGSGFGPHGEEHAWNTHRSMYSPVAQKALTSETRGQNSWVNFGPHAEHNKANPAQTVYADQKAGLLPDWAHDTDIPHPSLKKQEQLISNLYKNIGDSHSIKDRKPHFIFSAQKPKFIENKKIDLSHEEVVDFLERKGYKAEEISGKYGDDETSILVHNPPKHSIKHLLRLSSNLGQESSIYSDGYNHELHYHGGPNSGKHHKGQGTDFHKLPPEDYYSSLSDGTTFTHNFNFDDLHESDTSQVHQKPGSLKKSEEKLGVTFLCKNEKKDHPLESPNPEMNLIHYSPKGDLKELDSSHQGVRGIGAESKRAQPEHPTTFFYLEGSKPEDIVTSGSNYKHVVPLSGRKVYDLAKDPEGIYGKAKELASTRNVNPGVVQRRDIDRLIQEHGFHGFYNSSHPTMSNVVALYGTIPVKSSHRLHPNDFKEASSVDHHGEDSQLDRLKQFANEHGHHNHNFLHKLLNTLKSKK